MRRLLVGIALCLIPLAAWAIQLIPFRPPAAGGDGFPVVESLTETADATSKSTYSINLPATINSGDLLVMFVTTVDDSSVTHDSLFSSGWAQLASHTPSCTSNARSSTYVKTATGSEGPTQSFDTGGNAQFSLAAQVYRITGWNKVEMPTGATPSCPGQPDSPSYTPGYGLKKSLWISAAGYTNDPVTVSSYPANYTNGTATVANAGTDQTSAVLSVRRKNEVASEDPGAFSVSPANEVVAFTVAIEPL